MPPGAADTWTFASWEPELTYLRYRDASNGGLLVGRPGYTCAIAAFEEGLPIPPDDGRWLPSADPDAKAIAKAAAQAAGVTAKAGAAAGDTGEAVPATAGAGEK